MGVAGGYRQLGATCRDTAAYISHVEGPCTRSVERILADIRAETFVEAARWNCYASDFAAEIGWEIT